MSKAAPALLVLFAAGRHAPVEPCPASQVVADVAPPASRPSPFDSAFRAAGAEFHVPPTLLAGLGWVETRWQMVEGAEEFPGRAPAFGVMALRGAALERGAALAGVSVEAARHDAVANIRAAAALLDLYAREAGIDRDRKSTRLNSSHSQISYAVFCLKKKKKTKTKHEKRRVNKILLDQS